ncbi:hypothetical protein Droror1_Dr00023430 [Drosera rotundifolia]
MPNGGDMIKIRSVSLKTSMFDFGSTLGFFRLGQRKLFIFLVAQPPPWFRPPGRRRPRFHLHRPSPNLSPLAITEFPFAGFTGSIDFTHHDHRHHHRSSPHHAIISVPSPTMGVSPTSSPFAGHKLTGELEAGELRTSACRGAALANKAGELRTSACRGAASANEAGEL